VPLDPFIMRRVFFGLLAVLLGFLAAVGWYGYQHGFSRKWRLYLAQQFRKQGLEVSVRRLTLDPVHGLVAREMKVYDPDDRKHVIAVIDQANLGVNYSHILRGKALLDSVDLHDARLSIPIDPSARRGESMMLTHLHARIFFPPRQIYLSRADAEFCGMHIFATGRVVKPNDFHFANEGRAAYAARISRLIAELKALRYDSSRPLLQIEFSGDLARPEKLSASVRLHAVDVRRHEEKSPNRRYLIRKLDLMVTCRDGAAELQQLDIADARGEFHAHGSFELLTRRFVLNFHSSLDLEEMNRAFSLVQNSDIFLHDPPRMEFTVEGNLQPDPKFRAVGHVGLGNFSLKSEVFSSLAADASWDGERWSIRDLHLTHRSGGVTVDAMQLPGSFRAAIHGSMDPKAFLPLLSGKPAEWLSEFEFGTTPTVDADLSGASVDSKDLRSDGTIGFSKTSFRSMQVNGKARLSYADGVLTLAPFPDEQHGGAVTFDPGRDEVRFHSTEPAVKETAAAADTDTEEAEAR